MRPIKIVHIANLDVGLKIHLGNYMQYQSNQGYSVSAITHPGNWISHDTTILGGIRVKVIPFHPRLSPLSDLKTTFFLANYLAREKFDIVHTHTIKPGLLGRIAAKLARTPVIVHTIHGFFFFDLMPKTQYKFYVLIEKIGAACSDLLLSQNCQDFNTAINTHICAENKIQLLGNGIDLTKFNPEQYSNGRLDNIFRKFGIARQMPVIGFAARLEREKGIYEFLEAVKILKARGITARYLVIGAQNSKKGSSFSLQEEIKNLDIEAEVHHLGFCENMPELLSIMSVVVLPSYGREGIPRILMESAAMGKPVVASRVRGIDEAVQDGITGLLVPVKNSQALADGIEFLIKNPQRAAEMGQNGRQRALANFDERHFFWKTDIEYRRLLKSKMKIDADGILKPVPEEAIRLQKI